MNPERKRKIRLVVALSTAVLLSVALIYTSFSASTEARQPSEVLAGGAGGDSYQVTGVVVGENKRAGRGRDFKIADDKSGEGPKMRVIYSEGVVPDPFRKGREVIVTGKLNAEGDFVAEKDSLITKCPSKFSDEVDDTTNVQFVD